LPPSSEWKSKSLAQAPLHIYPYHFFPCLAFYSTLKMEAFHSTEISAMIYWTMHCHRRRHRTSLTETYFSSNVFLRVCAFVIQFCIIFCLLAFGVTVMDSTYFTFFRLLVAHSCKCACLPQFVFISKTKLYCLYIQNQIVLYRNKILLLLYSIIYMN
jgi:hypothetical protein